MGAAEEGNRFDAIVVGVGGHGSAALYHLAKRGQRVLGLEKFTIAHDNGSSHGLSRIIRLAYHEHPSYVPLLRRAYQLWEDLGKTTGSDVIHITGGLDIARPGPPSEQTYLNAVETVKKHNLEHELLSPEQVHSRFPGYELPAGYKAVYQSQGGIVAPERAIQAHVKAALAHGAILKEREPLQSWSPDGDGVVVRTAKGVYRAKKLVLTAGAWLPEIVPQLQAVTTVERQVIAWFEVDDEQRFKDNFPISIISDEQGVYYVFPPFDHPGLKIGLFNHLREVTKPDELSKKVTARDEEVTFRGGVTHTPTLEPRYWLSSLFCNAGNSFSLLHVADIAPSGGSLLPSC